MKSMNEMVELNDKCKWNEINKCGQGLALPSRGRLLVQCTSRGPCQRSCRYVGVSAHSLGEPALQVGRGVMKVVPGHRLAIKTADIASGSLDSMPCCVSSVTADRRDFKKSGPKHPSQAGALMRDSSVDPLWWAAAAGALTFP